MATNSTRLLRHLRLLSELHRRDGRPYDPGLLRDFHNSGSPDLVTYAVSDDLGSALVLLLIVPTVALALGSLSARLAAGPARNPRSGDGRRR